MHLKVAAAVFVGALGFAKAKVITVPAVDPSVHLDQYFGLDDNEPGCDPTYFTKVPNSALVYDFVGTEISLIGSTSSRGGVYDVYLDQQLQATIDRYANSVKLQCGLVTFNKKNLPYVSHNLRVVFRQNSTQAMPDAGAGYFDFSAIQYTVPDDALPSGTSGGTATQTAVPASTKSTPIGAIVGGVVGGVVALGVMAFLIWFLVFRKKSDTTNNEQNYGHQEDKGQYVMPFSPPATSVTPGYDGGAHRYQPVTPGYDGGALPYQPSPPPPMTGYQTQPFQWDANSNYMPQQSTAPVITSPISPTLTGSGRDSVAYRTDVSSSVAYKPDVKGEHSPSPPYPAPSHSPDGGNMMGGYQPNAGAPQPLPEEEIQRIAQAVLLQSSAAAVHEDPAGPPAYR